MVKKSRAKQWRDAAEAAKVADAGNAARFLMFASHPATMRLAIMWPALSQRVIVDPTTNAPKLPSDVWVWLWSHVAVSNAEIASLVGIARNEARQLYECAKASHLIYPDGSLDNATRAHLDILALARLAGPTGNPGAKLPSTPK